MWKRNKQDRGPIAGSLTYLIIKQKNDIWFIV